MCIPGRYKLANAHESNPYIVVGVNEHGDVYHIRPLLGGDQKTVQRKVLRLCPLESGESSLHSESGSDDSDWDFSQALMDDAEQSPSSIPRPAESRGAQ